MSNVQKLRISLLSGATALAVSLPQVYNITNKAVSTFENGCPTAKGLLLHTLVFFVITYLTMMGSGLSNREKIKYSLYSALIYYFIFSNPLVNVLESVTGLELTNGGCANTSGMAVQTVLYIASLYGVMFL